jgi:hypothetical protein
MGWFENDAKQTLGDVPLDILRRTFLDVAREYKQGVGRPPTLEELAELLRLVLSGADTSMIQDLEKRNVSAVKLATKPQPKKQDWETGDSFAVPLPDGTYAFGRVIWRAQPKKGMGVVEIFRTRSQGPLPEASYKTKGRLLPPVAVNGVVGFEEGRWRIFEHDPGFRAPDHDEIRVYSAGRDTVQLFDVEYKTVERDLPRAKLPKNATDANLYRNWSGKGDKLAEDVARLLDEARIEPS